MRTDRLRPRRLIAAVLLGLIATALFAVVGGVALGEDVEDITVSEGQTIKKDYPALAGVQPIIAIGGPTSRNPTNCASSTTTWCDTADLTIDVPSFYTPEDFFKVDIELTWPDPANSNDVDLYVYRTTGAQVLSSATANRPERVTLQDPPERKYFIVVANFQGNNTGYSLTVSFVPEGRFLAPEEQDEFNFGPSRFDDSDDSLSADSEIFGLPTVPQTGASTSTGPRPIDRPGPDGTLSRKTLVVLAASRAPGGNSRLPFIVSTTVAALGATGLAVFLYLRGRHDTDF